MINKRILSNFALGICMYLNLLNEAHAGAWLKSRGKTQIIITHDKSFNDNYSSGYDNVYLEYGLETKTIGANYYKKLIKNAIKEKLYRDDQILNIFVRKKIFSKNNLIISTESFLYIKPIGGQYKWLFGYNYSDTSFLTIELGIMKNYIDPININIDCSLGFNIIKNLKILAQMNNNYRHYKIGNHDKTIYRNKNYITHKNFRQNISASIIYSFNNKYSVQLGLLKKFNNSRSNSKFDVYTALWIDV